MQLGPGKTELLLAMGITAWASRAAGRRVTAAARPESFADDAQRWARLRDQVSRCTACDLHRTRTQTVFGVGDQHAQWMVVGEAPGQSEDRRGEPFVGRAGQLLNAMLAALGLRRDEVYIANTVKCRPPNNRDPEPGETAACAGFLNQQIQMIEPRVILAVGRIAAQTLLQNTLALGRLRGRVHRYRGVPVVATYHPAYLLRSPQQKRSAWQDLLLARSVVDASGEQQP